MIAGAERAQGGAIDDRERSQDEKRDAEVGGRNETPVVSVRSYRPNQHPTTPKNPTTGGPSQLAGSSLLFTARAYLESVHASNRRLCPSMHRFSNRRWEGITDFFDRSYPFHILSAQVLIYTVSSSHCVSRKSGRAGG